MTKIRIIKVNQTNLDIAMEHELWGRKRMGFKDWEKCANLLLIVGRALIAPDNIRFQLISWNNQYFTMNLLLQVNFSP